MRPPGDLKAERLPVSPPFEKDRNSETERQSLNHWHSQPLLPGNSPGRDGSGGKDIPPAPESCSLSDWH